MQVADKYRCRYLILTERVFGLDSLRRHQRFALAVLVDRHHPEFVLLALVEVLGSRLRVVGSDVHRDLRPLVGALRLLLEDVLLDARAAVVLRRLPLERDGVGRRLDRLERTLGRRRLV